MTTYRSKATIEAVQYTGAHLPGIMCDGGSGDETTSRNARMANGCDGTRAHLPHVHANVTGGMQVLAPGWWIFPVEGGPWGACTDEKFRSSWEVPDTSKPTIEELQKILDSEDNVPVVINPDGSLTALPVAANAAPDPATPTPKAKKSKDTD